MSNQVAWRGLRPRLLLQALDASDPAKAAQLRRELEALAAQYFENNTLRQDYLLTRAVKT